MVRFGSIGVDGGKEDVIRASRVRRRKIILVVCLGLKLWLWIRKGLQRNR